MPTISLYMKDATLAKLDALVARQASQDRASGRSGRQVATRSSFVEQLVESAAQNAGQLTRETIEYYVVSLAKEYGAAKVSLFGSFARGEETPESDVDILLDKGNIKGMQVLDFQDKLAEKLGRKVDVVTTAGASERLLKRIREDEVVLYAAG